MSYNVSIKPSVFCVCFRFQQISLIREMTLNNVYGLITYLFKQMLRVWPITPCTGIVHGHPLEYVRVKSKNVVVLGLELKPF